MKEYTYKRKGLRGLGHTGDGLHAQTATNLVLSAQGPRKRHGGVQQAAFGGAVRGIHSLYVGGRNGLLVYADRRFYWREQGEQEWADITFSASGHGVERGRLRDTPTSAFVHRDRAYILGCGDYLVLGYVDGVLQLRRVEENEDTYVPTTRVGIGCENNVTYVEVTVDEGTVGTYYVRQGETYAAQTLDGDTNLPTPDTQYYRRVAYPPEGQALDEPNLLTGYRINTLYGSPRPDAVYRLDAAKVDSDSVTEVKVRRQEENGVRTYTLRPLLGSSVWRCPVMGDDLSGLTLQVAADTTYGVGTLHLTPSVVGLPVLSTPVIDLRWESGGITATDWNQASLVLRTPTQSTVVAQASRINWLHTYKVTWYETSVALPADCGKVTYVQDVGGELPCTALLPTLENDLVQGNVVWAHLDYRDATLSFVKATTPEGVEDNITVRYKARTAQNAALIEGCTVGIPYGVGGNADRLFVGGNATCGHLDWHSQSDDWTYFVPSSQTALGNGGRIMGYMPHNGALLTLLEGPALNAYWRKGSAERVSVTVGNTTYDLLRARFAVERTAIMPTALAHTQAELGNDPVYAATDGVYRVMAAAWTDDRRALPLSAPLDELHLPAECVAIAYDGRYLLSDGQGVWVGDSRLRVSVEGSQNYEWTYWDIHDVTAWGNDGALWWGTRQGALVRLDEGYCDVAVTRTATGQLTVDTQDSRVCHDLSLSVAEGDEVIFATAGDLVTVPCCDVGGAKVYVDADTILHVYEGERWYALCGGERRGPYEVTEVDWGACSFMLCEDGTPVEWAAPPDTLVADWQGRTLYAVQVEAGGFALALRPNGPPVRIASAALYSRATLRHPVPVAACYRSEILAPGRAGVDKVLVGLSLRCDAACGGTVLSVRTSALSDTMTVGGQCSLDLERLALDKLTFDGDFARAYRARLKMRFAYVQWCVTNAAAGDVNPGDVCLHYRYLHTAKGVEE